MGLKYKIAQYREYKNGVSQCTFNPNGPGVVRIHLVPPRFSLFRSSAYIVILNGYYMLPVGYSWALMLSYFMREVNKYDGKPITDSDEELIEKNTIAEVRRVFPSAKEEELRCDMDILLDTLFAVARGDSTDFDIEKLSVRAYQKNMRAPHRMDLMVSAMTDECGSWKCNQKCKFCYAAGQKMSGVRELTTDEWRQVIDRLDAAGVPMVTFTGGEPTLREDIAELVGYAKRMVTRLNTNGVNLTEKLVEQLKAAGLDSLQVTLYSHDPEVHNALVGAERFEDTVRGIKRAVAAGLDISINTPLCKKNSDYEETLKLISSLGVRFVTVSGLICMGAAGVNHEDYDLTSDELFEIVKRAKEFTVSAEMEMDFTSPGLIPKEKLEEINMNVPSCGAALSNMAIAPDGTVVPCQSWLTEGAGLGNILRDPFKKIWTHPVAKRLRHMTDEEALNCPFRSGKVVGRV